MRRGFRRRLVATHLAVAVLAVVVAAGIATYAESRRFDDYLRQAQRARNEAVVRVLAATYRAPVGWDATAVYTTSRVAAESGVDAAVYSLDGDLIFTVEGSRLGGAAEALAGAARDGSPSPEPRASGLRSSDFAVGSYAVRVAGAQVATAQIYAPRDSRTAADRAYSRVRTRNVIIAAAVAAVLALLASLLIARLVTVRLEELADAAGDIAAGDHGVRVSPRADDEVGLVAVAVNAMADKLVREEQWRRDMTSDLTEQLGAPLAAIRARLGDLERGALAMTQENLRPVSAEVARLSRQLADLRSLDELEDDDLAARHERLDLAEVAGEATARAGNAFAAKGVVLETELEAVDVVAGRDHLLQVVASLLDNALRFTPEGGRVSVAVSPGDGPDAVAAGLPAATDRAEQPAAARAWAQLAVADNGPGIDPVDLPFVFDRYYRGQAARGAAGVGLGLTLCHAVAKMYGGAIVAAAAPGGGALITVFLPVAE